jgi:hypothetical protein
MAAPERTITQANVEKEPEVRDVEGGEEHALQRQASGPPYSVFTKAEKIWIITLVSTSALISPFGATLFYPVLNVLSDVLKVTPTMTNISITTYMVELPGAFVVYTLTLTDCASHSSCHHRRHV